MKLLVGIAFTTSVLLGTAKPERPDSFFQPNNQVTYSESTVTRAWGTTRNTSILTIESVIEKQGGVSSVCKAEHYNEQHKLTHEYRLRFAADSSNFYVHAANWLHERWTTDGNYQYSGDSLWYPFNMKVGDTLRNSWAAKDFNTNGVAGGEQWVFKNRKVVALDTFELTIGKIVAYKIEMHVVGTSKTKDQHTGNQTNFTEYDAVEWFSPSLGIVKSLYLTTYGDTRVVMESYKK